MCVPSFNIYNQASVDFKRKGRGNVFNLAQFWDYVCLAST